MILATDLDGTFLGGEMNQRMELYRLIKEAKDFTLVFVTGRGLETVIPLLNDPLIPTPDYIIADVGATIVNGHTLDKIEPIQSEIERNWTEVFDLRQALATIEGIEPQEVPQQRRSSFYYSNGVDLTKVMDIAEKKNLDVITSVDKYLDLLPKGVNKGSTLRKLIDMLGVADERVLVAGDTMNDLAMFQIGCKGVVVGASEAALFDTTAKNQDVYHAKQPGAGGVLEAMQRLDSFRKLFPANKTAKVKRKATKNQLVIVYHRLPYEKSMIKGQSVRHAPKSPNGIIPSLLGLFENGRAGIWIGEEAQQKDGKEVGNQLIDAQKYPKLWSSTISLSKKDIDQFYRVFSKEAFWPTIFSFVDKARFNHEDWNHYLRINKIFADRVAKEADHGAFVWIHEYNLWMVPAYLKPLRPDLKIGFFHHTSFPGADVFNILPWRREIIGSLLLCDFISFHIPRYVENFVDVLRSHVPFRVVKTINAAKQFLTYSCALGVESMTKIIEVEGRKIRLGAQPVGVNMASIKRALTFPKVKQHIQRMQVAKHKKDIKTILSIERLDYVKGPLEKIKAFGEFLEDYPEYREKVALINICTPPSQGMKIYDQVRDELNQAIGEINGKYATMDWLPIQYFYRSLPFDEVVTYYGISDIAWITPLRDGLNLVAKEYIATKGLLNDFSGALVLSEFAGASVELPYAILTNPYDRKSMIESLLKALMMDEQEQAIRIQRSFEAVSHFDVEYWGKDFVQELEKS
ncbi:MULTISPECIES: glucosylglycerol-phosphate synthase [Olivibacter]|uniref:Glucosylglycerol-phosphate synthase n=1 Tax=Olivibacter jilunii TaxID=985016 RepID=A0ABW6B198_9SPHI|nr:glucosylglycerol-phosphate synthase [Olivibacter sp. UJ_SKK_5.1]MDX3916563.1 glucosylglycerol-phosphate synthase [Pseudosphingobacterium sp.]